MPGPINASGLIPPSYSQTILQEAQQQSLALKMGRQIPIPGGVSHMPLPATFPTAAWTSVGARKAYTDFSFTEVTIQAEELAAVITIPDTYLDDTAINLWNYAKPLLSEAIAVALDDAILWGVNAPATFPVGGVVADAQAVTAATDVVQALNVLMATVEAQGLRVNGDAADIPVMARLRGVRDAQGALLFGPAQANSNADGTVYGVPINFSQFPTGPATNPDIIAGDWNQLVIGVRQDIRFEMSSDAVIADGTGKVLVSGFQDNQTALKVWARYGAVILHPVTRRHPTGAKAFAKADISTLPAGFDIPQGDEAPPTKSK